MGFRSLVFLLGLWVGATAQAASGTAPVQVQRITPAGEEVPAGRQIVIQFNRAMVPLGRMERRAEEVAVVIEPALQCQWRWLNVSALACQLDEAHALRPATRYQVTVAAGFAAADGATLSRPLVHQFITERPRLEQAYLNTWRGPGSPVLRLQFNLPVTQQSVQRALQFRGPQGQQVGLTLGEISSRRPAGATLLPLPGEQQFILAAPLEAAAETGAVRRYWDAMPSEPLPGGAVASLQVQPGLVTPTGPLAGVEQRQALQFHTFPAFRFLGVRCQDLRNHELRLAPPQTEQACNPMQPVALAFSAPVLSDEIGDHVQVTPDLAGGRKDYDPWQNQRSYSALGGAYQPGQAYLVYLPERLQARQQYDFRAPAGAIRDEFGRALENPLQIRFQTSARPPSLSLMYRQAVIESEVGNDVPLTVTNLQHLDVRYSGLTSAGAVPQQTVRLPLPTAPDSAFHQPLGLQQRLAGRSGVITGELVPEPRFPGYRPQDYRFFAQATPFQVHFKLGHFNSIAWVTDLATGEPVADAHVQVYLDDYRQLQAEPEILAAARTGADGLAQLPGRQQLDPQLAYQYPWEWEQPRFFVRVVRGADFALLPLDYDFEISTGAVTNWSIYGWARPKAGFVRAWGTTAQGVYRAGDNIQYKLYVRSQDNRRLIAAPAGPYQLKIIDPTGKPVAELQGLQLDGFGALAGEFKAPAQGAVGWYRFELSAAFLPAPLPALQVLVADFTPAAFKVSSRLNGDLFVAGEPVRIETQASMHAGGPYADAKARVTARVHPRALQPAGSALQGFYFQTLRNNRSPETVFQREDRVDARGQLQTSFTIQAEHVLYGRLDVESAVSDDRGSAVAGFASARYAGRDRYVGLRQQSWLLRQGEPAAVDVIVVDAGGTVLTAVPVAVRVEYEEVTAARVKGAGNAFITRYNQVWREASRCQLQAASEPAVCRFTPPVAGRYRLLAEIQDSQGRPHQTEIQQWAAGQGQVLWAEPPSNRLEIVPQQDSYRVGDTARYLVKNPLPGAQALITVERYGVLEQRVQRLEGSTPVLELPVTADMIPGFYLSVVAVSPRVAAPPGPEGVDLGRPTLRMGYVETKVGDQHQELLIEAKPAQPLYRPGETVRLELQARPRHGERGPVQLTVAVLDEAVFDLVQGGERYFDPYQGFYQLEALDLANYSLLMRLIGLQKFEKKGANAGGDGGEMDVRRIERYVSYWNPDVQLDRQGRAQVEFTAPDNLTGWRVLVLGVTPEDKFGLGQTRFQVNQPIEIRPAMPNQVLRGDQFQAGFSVMNRSPQERTLHLQWQVGEVAAPLQPLEQSLHLQPFQRQTAYLPLQTRLAGTLRISLTASAGEERDKLEYELPVREPISLLTAANYGSLTAGALEEALRYPSEIQAAAGGLSVALAPSVIGNLDGAFRYLRDYPYSGWEQLLGRAVMAAHFSALRAYLPPELDWPQAAELPAEILQQAASFQAPSGGMAFFKADDAYVSPYLSAYTVLAFNWLRASGQEIPALVEQRLHDYLATLLRRDVLPDFYSPGMSATVRAVALAALAERGRLSRDDLERYRRHVPLMSLFGQAHYLLAALATADSAELRREALELMLGKAVHSGGKLSFNEALDDGYVRILATPLRSQCAILAALTAISGSPEAAALLADQPLQLARTITQARGNRDHWENTQENLFCVQALLAYSGVYEQAAPALQVTARLDGQFLGEAGFDSVRDQGQVFLQPMRAEDVGQERTLRLQAQGQGRLYYGLRLNYAPRASDPSPVNAGIELRREYSVRRGGEWQLLESPLQLQRGELVRVDLYLSLPTARHFVVVSDPVPGGLEPVNRQLATASTVAADAAQFQPAGGAWYLRYSDWISYNASRWSFYHQELRHDAARFYSDYLPPGNYHLSYSAQAIAAGEFRALPAQAEELYDPDIFGKTQPVLLQVGE